MMPATENMYSLWLEARTRFTGQLVYVSEADLLKQLPPAFNRAGFLIRHIAEVELLFAKNVFGSEGVKVHAKTVIAKQDTGEWDNLKELFAFQAEAEAILGAAIRAVPDSGWGDEVHTREFGTKTKAEALGRIVSHTAFHAGQLALILKYGT
jgi:uncharacterized damage-inducible protein DinB